MRSDLIVQTHCAKFCFVVEFLEKLCAEHYTYTYKISYFFINTLFHECLPVELYCVLDLHMVGMQEKLKIICTDCTEDYQYEASNSKRTREIRIGKRQLIFHNLFLLLFSMESK